MVAPINKKKAPSRIGARMAGRARKASSAVNAAAKKLTSQFGKRDYTRASPTSAKKKTPSTPAKRNPAAAPKKSANRGEMTGTRRAKPPRGEMTAPAKRAESKGGRVRYSADRTSSVKKAAKKAVKSAKKTVKAAAKTVKQAVKKTGRSRLTDRQQSAGYAYGVNARKR